MKSFFLGVKVMEAVREFNRRTLPSVNAEVELIEEGRIEVKFRGISCSSCGSRDYVDYFTLILSKQGIRILDTSTRATGYGLTARFAYESQS